MQQASSMLIPVELELGGKDPMIVFDDVNLDRASAAAVWGAFTNTGQSCTSVERLYVQQNIFSQFRDLVVQKTKMMTQAIDSDGNGDIGHMTTPMQRDIVRAHLEDALKKGAVQLTGENWDRQSMAIPAIVLDNVNHEMLVMREETFGPLLPICAFQDEAEVIALANDSAYGLSASVWSKNKLRAVRVARAIDTGNVSINNVMVSEGNHYLPFGGVKDSGIGRYKGAHGLRMFCNMKSVLIDSDSSKIEANWYPYTSEKFQLFAAMTDGLFRGTLKGFVAFAVNGMKLESYSAKAAKNLLDGKK
jgi:aldehyde dehydrogenase (NAD+)